MCSSGAGRLAIGVAGGQSTGHMRDDVIVLGIFPICDCKEGGEQA